MAKPSVGHKASQFLSQIGTAGGPVGGLTSPGLVSFGAGRLQQDLMAGNTDQYLAQRTQAASPVLGSPQEQPAAMPNNLDASYVKLNLPGSPLPMHGLMTAHSTRAAQVTQDNIVAMDQRMFSSFMPPTGQLPVTPLQAAAGAAQQLHSQAAKKRGGSR